MAAPSGRGPARELLSALSAVSSRFTPAQKWDASAAAEARAAIGAFCLSQETMTLSEAESTWRDALSAVIETYSQTRAPEAAMMAQNFPGMILWRVSVTWDRQSWKAGVSRLAALIDDITGETTVSWLSRSDLKISSRFGPASLRAPATEWLATFVESAERAFGYTPDGLLNALDALPKPDELASRLVRNRFEFIYDFPFVQEGIRLVSRATGWILPFAITARCTTNRVFTPLTRALFTIALVDQYFWGPRAVQPQRIAELFSDDADALGPDELLSPAEANATKRTAYEVRVSAALAYADPYARDVRPGLASSRVRSGPEILASPTSLTRDALAVHMSAVLNLISSDDGGYAQDRSGAASTARANLLESAHAAWDAVQNSTSAKQMLEALIESGFLPQMCRAYETALKAQYARGHGASGAPAFDELQQTVGCLAVTGNVVFGLMESYGPGLDYLDNYLDATYPSEYDDRDFMSAVGLPSGAVSQLLGRCIPPRAFSDYVRKIREALVAEIDESERRAGADGGAPSVAASNSARESLLLWFDLRAHELWGVPVPTDAASGSQSNWSEDGSGDDGGVEAAPASDSRAAQAGAVALRENIMIASAAAIRYPEPMPNVPELADQAFSRYVVATAVADALSATASAVFSLPHLTTSVKVLTWARDYGAPYIASFHGHKSKITALISALLPFAGENPPRPTPEDAANVESLLGELHGAVEASAARLPARIGLDPPPRPDVSNSALLVSMYATSLRLAFEDLTDRTMELTEKMASASWMLADAASTARAFFSCGFGPGPTGGTVTLHGRGKRAETLGTWSIRDLMSAVGDAYGACTDVMTEIRVAAMALRSLAEETARRIPTCDALAGRAATASSREGGASRVFSVLSADYAGLARVHTTLDLHVRKLVACAEPPGMRDVAWLLGQWAVVSALDGSVRDAGSLVKAIEALGSAWREAEAAREKRVPGTSDPPTSADVEAAVADVMEEYEPLEDAGGERAVVTLTSRYNLTSRDDINFRTLDLETVAPSDVNPAGYADDFIVKTRVTADVLTGIVDSIFNSNRQAVGAHPRVAASRACADDSERRGDAPQ
uniref:UL37 tegument protein n=1 Tax=Anatid alphaherpesvirus 2 TaxID=3080522 RepID=A0AAU0K6K4_9ALPH